MMELFNIDSDIWKKACELFGRTEDSLDEDVETVKNWLKTQLHLPEIMEDIKIRNFLLLNKCSVEKTKQKIDMYYTIRSHMPDMYEKCNPKSANMKEMMKYTYFCMHPKLHDGLYRMFFLKAKESNRYSPRDTVMQLVNYSEVRLYEDCMIGDILVIDLGNFSVYDMAKLTPTMMWKTAAIYQKVFSMRVRAIYYINSPVYISKLMSILKVILPVKIFSRIQICENAGILKKILPKQDLPKDYGGEGPSLEELQQLFILKLDQYQERFDLLDILRVDERLRPQELDNDEMLGFHGNFKKLNID